MTHPDRPDDPSRRQEELEKEKELDEASKRSRALPDSLARHLSESVNDIARLVKEASAMTVTSSDWMEWAIIEPPVLPMEYYSSGSGVSTPKVTVMRRSLTERLAALAGSETDAVDLRSQARAKFVAVVLGVGATAEVTVGQAADGVLAQLAGALPLAGATGPAAEMARTWRGTTEPAFWSSLAAATQASAELTGSRIDHLVWMGLVCELSPMDADFAWERPRDQQQLVDHLIAAAGEEHDIDMVYDAAAQLRYNGRELPRAVTAELVQLALANLAEVQVDQSSRLDVLDNKPPEPDYASMTASNAARARKLYDAREMLRNNALALHTEPMAPTGREAYKDPWRSMRATAYGYALVELWTGSLSNARGLIDRRDNATARRAKFDKVVADSTVPELLVTWSTGVAGDSPDLTGLAETSRALTAEITRLRGALKTEYTNPMDTGPDKYLDVSLIDIANELSVESADLLSDHPADAQPFDGVRSEVRYKRDGAFLLFSARLAVKKRWSIAKLVTDMVSDAAKLVKFKIDGGKLTDAAWLQDVAAKAAAVQNAVAAGDANQLIGATHQLAETVKLARMYSRTLQAAGADEQAAALAARAAAHAAVERILDVTSLSLCERIDAFLDDADVDVQQSALPADLGSLRRQVTRLPALDDPAKSWSTGKDLLLATVPDAAERNTLKKDVFTADFSSALSKWMTEAGRKPLDRDSLLARTWTVADVLNAYATGIDDTISDPVARAGFQDLLGQISATVDTRMAGLDGVAPPPM
jgi:hypothetical protein